MPLLTPDPLFSGGTASNLRKYLHNAIKEAPQKHYLLPSVGAFHDAETLVAAGIKTSDISTSDTTLFASALGYYFSGKPIADLGFKPTDPMLVQLIAPLPKLLQEEQCATILFAIKWAQLSQSDNDFIGWQRKQFEEDAAETHAIFVAAVQRMKEKLGGIKYQIKAMIPHALDHMLDDETTMLFTPSFVSGGQVRLFNLKMPRYTWAFDTPVKVTVHEQKDFMESIAQAPMQSIAVLAEPLFDRMGHKGWHPLLREQQKDMTYRMIISNREPSKEEMIRRKIEEPLSTVFPVYDDHPLNKQSQIAFQFVDKATAMYYYDLFVKGLGMPNAENFALLTIDGQVAGVVGPFLRAWRTKRSPVFADVFSITIPNTKRKLGRLMTHLLCTREVVEWMIAQLYEKMEFGARMEYYQTTFLSASPSVMKVRGIMKLKDREKLPNGTYKLQYITTLKPYGIKEVLNGWIDKDHGNADEETSGAEAKVPAGQESGGVASQSQ